MSDFYVGPRKQGIPEYAANGLGSRWHYLRLFSVNRKRDKPYIVSVYRQIIFQCFDRNLNWINEWAYSEDVESWNNGDFRVGEGGPGGRFPTIEEAKDFAAKRYNKLSSLWPVIEDVTAIDLLSISPMLLNKNKTK
jgi:hypothetical protein